MEQTIRYENSNRLCSKTRQICACAIGRRISFIDMPPIADLILNPSSFREQSYEISDLENNIPDLVDN